MAGSKFPIPKPMTVKEISDKATEFEFNPFIALKYWLRTAETLVREAQIYEQEGNDQQAYLLLMRYAVLVTEQLPRHPQARDPESQAGLKAAKKTVPGIISRLELLKPRINARYATWQTALAKIGEANLTTEADEYGGRTRMDADPAVAGKTTTLPAAENSELAVKLAHNEIRRRETKRRAARQITGSEQEEQDRRIAGLWDDWEAALSKRYQAQDDDEMQRQMQASHRRLEAPYDYPKDGLGRRVRMPEPPRMPNNEFRYPSIPKSQPITLDGNHQSQRSRSKSPARHTLPPKPPKERFEDSIYDRPPARPDKTVLDTQSSDISSLDATPEYTFEPSAYLENGNPLRTVFLPPALRTQFLEVAAPNTRNNLETCGMLCGTLVSNALFISHVVIPEQESTSDTCETINESAFFDYCASEDLMVLGWIHTHPTQTCFLSSRDLHTHCGYQIMMAESIAIVCAPSKEPSWGVFRLTDPPGMSSVLHCRKTGLFHPHDESNIYTNALRPGHVYEAEGLKFKVVDLRPK
ncbi:hypothetical protein B0O99DRAFT_653976 [Bisporella sp. PMI_857]|nr:hypothetical protein B0O99DRAFT_653976 [Bisporella sp. PMI_857]